MLSGWSGDFVDFDLDGLEYSMGKTKRIGKPKLDLEPSGSLEDWSAAANMLFAAGCEAQSFMLLASFAAPLMALFDTDEGGAIVSIHGGRKSGKTVAMTASATVWGLPEAMDIGEAPHSQRFKALASLRHLPAIYNGLSRGDPLAANAFIGTAILQMERHLSPWQTLILHTGGQPLAGSITQGLENILGVEFKVAVPKGLVTPRDGDHIEERLLDNRGNAGDAYLKYLANPAITSWARNKVGIIMGELREKTGAGDDWRFAMRAIAAVSVAGDIVKSLGILDMYPSRIVDWAIEKTFSSSAPSQLP